MFPPGAPLLTILVGVAFQRLLPISLPFVLATPARYWLGGLIIALAFFGLGLWAVLLVRGSGQSENPWKPTRHIVERGPFRVTRNPMYLQMVVGCVGFAILLWNPWILILTPVCAWVLQRWAIIPEEAYLERKFPQAYGDYRQRVRRWL